MEIPFDIIVDTEFTNAAPGSGLASFVLSRPPMFYLESFSPPSPGQGSDPIRHWKKCADWTEDQQATKVLRHNLVGSAVQLAHLLRHLNAHTSGSDIPLHSPSYHSQEPSPAVLEIPSTSLAAFDGTGYHYLPEDSVDPRQPDHQILTHKRSFSPVSGQQLTPHDEPVHLPIARPPSGVASEPDLSMYSQYPRHSAIEVSQPSSYTHYPETALPHHTSFFAFC